ncbi:H(+)-transporting V1 sector ATPase subunit H [Physocladia obscura]|uniref:V-type proton ATPase subunit H n=1 Tax=Physocladia obscura TaxID=109957 RepID=A0AAD5XJY2_9FUNG|nr:H(+)-transporting V1 sector ATPase subunit H [Physocladia obscura]
MVVDKNINIAPVVAGHNNYLEDQTAAVREKTIPWEGYQKAALITEDELKQIRQFEKVSVEALKESGANYSLLLLSLLQKLARNDTIQNILVVFEDKILGFSDREEILAQLEPSLLFGTFINLLSKDDEYVQLKSAKIVAVLALERSNTAVDVDPSPVFSWLTGKFADPNPNVVDIVIQILQTLLAVPSYRLAFYKTRGAMNGFDLIDAIKATSSNPQMQYQGIYCMWTMTFVQEIAADIQRSYEVIPLFIDIAKAAIKEKVVRVIFSTVKNMINLAPQENIIPMLGNKLLNLSETLAARKWTDTEITEDLEYIKEELAKNINSLSTFDEYSSEVKSGKLEWSPPHLSEQFWKQNASRFSEKDYELVRVLGRLIATNTSPIVLAVAAHDIGQYVKYAPVGKKFVQDNGTKTQIMQLMTHENSDVRYQALIAVQKLMANSWIS